MQCVTNWYIYPYECIFTAFGTCLRGKLKNLYIYHSKIPSCKADELRIAFRQMLLNNWNLEHFVCSNFTDDDDVTKMMKEELQSHRRFQALASICSSRFHPAIQQLLIDLLISAVETYQTWSRII